MLHLFPCRVWPERAECPARSPKNGYIGWEDDEPDCGVAMNTWTHFVSSNGSSGRPDPGTAEKGKNLVDTAIDALAKFIRPADSATPEGWRRRASAINCYSLNLN